MDCLIATLCQGLTVGLHLVSLHSAPDYVSETNVVGPKVTRQFETLTPGVYARAESGLTVGAYRNSYGKPSAYLGWTFATDDDRFALTLGAVTGYRRTIKENRDPALNRPPAVQVVGDAVQPLVVPSMRFSLGENTALRVSYVPEPRKGDVSVVHLSIEAGF